MIPAETVMETYIRANDNETLFEAAKRFDGCVAHGAEALELGYSIETTAGYLPLHQSKELNDVVLENMRLFCEDAQIVKNPISGASGDVGDLGTLLPTVQFGFSGIAGRFHSDEFSVQDEENCYLDAAKVMAGVVFDLLTCSKKRIKREGFAEKKAEYLYHLRRKE